MVDYKIVIFNEDNIEYYGKNIPGSMHVLYLMDFAKKKLKGKISDQLYSSIEKVNDPTYMAAILSHFLDVAILLRDIRSNEKYASLLLPESFNAKILKNILENKNIFEKISYIDYEIPILDSSNNLLYETVLISENKDFENTLMDIVEMAKLKKEGNEKNLFTK